VHPVSPKNRRVLKYTVNYQIISAPVAIIPMLAIDIAVADAFAAYMQEEGFEVLSFAGAYQSEIWWKIAFRCKYCKICERKHESQNNYWKQFKEGEKMFKNVKEGESERGYPSAYIGCYQQDYKRSVRRPWFPATEDLYIMHERGYLVRWKPFFYASHLEVPKKRKLTFEIEESDGDLGDSESSEDSLEEVEKILAEESPLKN